MLTMLCSKVSCLLKVTTLPTHRNCCIKVELQIARRFDELFEFVDILQFCITIKQKGGVVSRSFVMFVQFFQILDQVVNPLCIKILEIISE